KSGDRAGVDPRAQAAPAVVHEMRGIMADIQFPNTLFGPGTATIVVNDNNGAPAAVLEAADAFTIGVSWTVDALFALLAGGQWEVAAYVEGIGGAAPEQQVGATQTVLLNGGRNYATTITVPGGTLPDNPAPPNSGVYKLVVVLTHRNFTLVSNVAAVIEHIPMLRIG
ncbi:MAG: hypothetical protein L0H84_23575, partial [Pseudonocardia sp.]|nr:hypothetical protein [Pseudonocardia sp.]